jgi:hypothetical protein
LGGIDIDSPDDPYAVVVAGRSHMNSRRRE